MNTSVFLIAATICICSALPSPPKNEKRQISFGGSGVDETTPPCSLSFFRYLYDLPGTKIRPPVPAGTVLFGRVVPPLEGSEGTAKNAPGPIQPGLSYRQRTFSSLQPAGSSPQSSLGPISPSATYPQASGSSILPVSYNSQGNGEPTLPTGAYSQESAGLIRPGVYYPQGNTALIQPAGSYAQAVKKPFVSTSFYSKSNPNLIQPAGSYPNGAFRPAQQSSFSRENGIPNQLAPSYSQKTYNDSTPSEITPQIYGQKVIKKPSPPDQILPAEGSKIDPSEPIKAEGSDRDTKIGYLPPDNTYLPPDNKIEEEENIPAVKGFSKPFSPLAATLNSDSITVSSIPTSFDSSFGQDESSFESSTPSPFGSPTSTSQEQPYVSSTSPNLPAVFSTPNPPSLFETRFNAEYPVFESAKLKPKVPIVAASIPKFPTFVTSTPVSLPSSPLPKFSTFVSTPSPHSSFLSSTPGPLFVPSPPAPKFSFVSRAEPPPEFVASSPAPKYPLFVSTPSPHSSFLSSTPGPLFEPSPPAPKFSFVSRPGSPSEFVASSPAPKYPLFASTLTHFPSFVASSPAPKFPPFVSTPSPYPSIISSTTAPFSSYSASSPAPKLSFVSSPSPFPSFVSSTPAPRFSSFASSTPAPPLSIAASQGPSFPSFISTPETASPFLSSTPAPIETFVGSSPAPAVPQSFLPSGPAVLPSLALSNPIPSTLNTFVSSTPAPDVSPFVSSTPIPNTIVSASPKVQLPLAGNAAPDTDLTSLYSLPALNSQLHADGIKCTCEDTSGRTVLTNGNVVAPQPAVAPAFFDISKTPVTNDIAPLLPDTVVSTTEKPIVDSTGSFIANNIENKIFPVPNENSLEYSFSTARPLLPSSTLAPAVYRFPSVPLQPEPKPIQPFIPILPPQPNVNFINNPILRYPIPPQPSILQPSSLVTPTYYQQMETFPQTNNVYYPIPKAPFPGPTVNTPSPLPSASTEGYIYPKPSQPAQSSIQGYSYPKPPSVPLPSASNEEKGYNYPKPEIPFNLPEASPSKLISDNDEGNDN